MYKFWHSPNVDNENKWYMIPYERQNGLLEWPQIGTYGF